MTTIKTREPDESFQAHVPGFQLEKRKRHRYRTWRDDPDEATESVPAEAQEPTANPQQTTSNVPAEALPQIEEGLVQAPNEIPPEVHAEPVDQAPGGLPSAEEENVISAYHNPSNDTGTTPSQHPVDTGTAPSRHGNDTETTPKQHADNTTKSLAKPLPTPSRHGVDTINDTESTPKRHRNNTTQTTRALASNDTQPTLKQHRNDTDPPKTIWEIAGLKREVVFALCELGVERRTTKIIGITYDEIAARSGVRPSSVRTTMKRLRDDGWIGIDAKRGNNRTIGVDVGKVYNQYVTEARALGSQPTLSRHANDTTNDTQTTQASPVVVLQSETTSPKETKTNPPPTTTTAGFDHGFEALKRQRQAEDELIQLISWPGDTRSVVGIDNIRELIRKGHRVDWIQEALDIFAAWLGEPDPSIRNPPALFMSQARKGLFVNPPRGYIAGLALENAAKQQQEAFKEVVERERERYENEQNPPKIDGSLDDIPF